MNLGPWIAWMLGLQDVERIDRIDPALAASWAREAPAWLFFGWLGFTAAAMLFYVKYQPGRRIGAKLALASVRAVVLGLLLLILAEPVAELRLRIHRRSELWLVFDGTESMALADRLPFDEQTRLAEAVGMAAPAVGDDEKPVYPSRVDYLKAMVARDEDNLLKQLSERYQLRVFLFEGPGEVRQLELSSGASDQYDGHFLAEQLTTDGTATDLHAALAALAGGGRAENLAAVVLMSDFNHNSGPSPHEAAVRLGVPLLAVGVGPSQPVDLKVTLDAPAKGRRDKTADVAVELESAGLPDREVTVTLTEQWTRAGESTAEKLVEEKTVRLADGRVNVPFSYKPEETGSVVLAARVEPLDEELIDQNNTSRRKMAVDDDIIRILYVAYEPTWEWRFVKEVFHRHKDVGEAGFRTYLRSADPTVRESNPLFETTLVSPRSEFFETDVVILDGVPAAVLSPRFCEMTKELVLEHGGGLIVLAGTRFGPGELADTALAELLPVVVDPAARLRSDKPFDLQRTPKAASVEFMQLQDTTAENDRAWGNLGPLHWYQPVLRPRSGAVVLAEHPTDTCVDGKMPQPIIAYRRFLEGQVIYCGFNEIWRLRRKHGERYYGRFWAQMLHRLSSPRATGGEKRFSVRSDYREYRPGDEAVITVRALNADYRPLAESDIPGHVLRAQWLLPGDVPSEPSEPRPIRIPSLTEGTFEVRLPLSLAGRHEVLVTDPITNEQASVAMDVASLPLEDIEARRNVALQESLARDTGGRSFDLAGVHDMVETIESAQRIETTTKIVPLWNTWLAFICVIALLLGEWLARKWINLT